VYAFFNVPRETLRVKANNVPRETLGNYFPGNNFGGNMNEKYMKIAINEAEKALKLEEMPVGCVIVYKNKIIAKSYNKKEKLKNSLMHAEIIAINKACKKLNDWRLNDCVMYVTLEPCHMCMGAIVESRIKQVYCGIKNNKSHDINLEVAKNENVNLSCGLLSDKIEIQLNKFFAKIRSN